MPEDEKDDSSPSAEAEDRELPLSDALKAELRARLEEYDRDPEAGESWEELRDELLSRHRRKNVSAA